MSPSPFKPAWWLRNRHAQTLWPTLGRRRIRLHLRRERLRLPDGDFLDLDWTRGNAGPGTPLVVVFHGLMGSIESPYARGILRQIQRCGWRGVFIHFRSCSGEPNRKDRFYHSGDTGDMAFVVESIKQREPDAQVAAIGYSLGGNALLKWLGETGSENALAAAVAVSVPFDLQSVADTIHRGFSRTYEKHLIDKLSASVRAKIRSGSHVMPVTENELRTLKTFWEFDEAITAPLHQFKDARDYYVTCSARQFLPDIRRPSLILHALDDPFMTPNVLPESHELSESTQMEVSERGGHVGFVHGAFPWSAKYWLEDRIPQYLGAFLNTAPNDTRSQQMPPASKRCKGG